MNLSGNYIIYENWTRRRLVIHQMGCPQVAKRGGVSGTTTGGFPSRPTEPALTRSAARAPPLVACILALTALVLFAGCIIPIPLPGPPDTEDTSDWVWSNRWLEFDREPTVCGGVLRASGHTRNDAALMLPNRVSDINHLVLYRRSDSAPQYGYGRFVAEPVLGFLRPLGAREYYTDLDATDQIATTLIISATAFELVSDVPPRIANNPSDYVFGVWGYRRPTEPPETLRDKILRSC